MNFCMQVFVLIKVFKSIGWIPKSKIAGCYGITVFSFGRDYQTFKVAFYIPTSSVWEFLLLYILASILVLFAFWILVILMGAWWHFMVVICNSPLIKGWWVSFHTGYLPSGISSVYDEVSVQIFGLFFNESIVYLQCVHFRCTTKWFSYIHICIFFSEFFPLVGYYKILSILPCTIQ